MQKIISIVLSFLLIAGMEVMGQDITTRLLTLTAPSPPTVKQVSTTVVGNPGNATYYYWVVAKYASGNANPSAAAIVINAPNVLSVSAYIRVNWDAVAGATGYDVLRTTTASVPSGNCNCAVVTATASTTVNDQGGALGAYTVSSQGAVSSSCNLDNLSSATPVVTCAPYGWTPGGVAGGALTGNYPNPLIANVTTPGAVAFVSATPGVLTQDATKLFYNSTTKSFGVGTATLSYPLTRNGITLQGQSVDGTEFVMLSSIDTGFTGFSLIRTGADIAAWNRTTGYMAFGTNNIERGRFSSSGNFLIGTTTDGNFKLDIAASGSSGTLRVYDQTATTGSTSLVVRAGAGDITGSTIVKIQNNAGALVAFARPDGLIGGSVLSTEDITVAALAGAAAAAAGGYTVGLNFRSTGAIGWSNTTNWFDSKDTGIAKSSSGVVEINNGTAGTLRDLLLRYLQNTGVTVATLPAAAAGNAGTRAYVTDANATTIGTTVAGGGANKVMVWSDGTNWKIYAN